MRYKDRLIEISPCRMQKQSSTSNNEGKWKHLKVIQTTPEQRTGKARNQGTTKNSHIGHCTHNAESTILTLRLLMSYIYIYGAPSRARNANVVYIWTYVSQR